MCKKHVSQTNTNNIFFPRGGLRLLSGTVDANLVSFGNKKLRHALKPKMNHKHVNCKICDQLPDFLTVKNTVSFTSLLAKFVPLPTLVKLVDRFTSATVSTATAYLKKIQ